MKITKSGIIRNIIFGICLFLVVFSIKKPYEAESLKDLMQDLSDCTVIPGVFMILIYALLWSARDGAFDGIGYGLKFFASMFIPNPNLSKGKDGFYEYKQSKAEKRKEGIGKEQLFVGFGYLIVSIVFYVIYLFV